MAQKLQLIKPRRLSLGDTIAIVSPSSGLANAVPHRVERGVNALKDMGFQAVFAPHALERDGYVSASAEKRASDLHWAFSNPSVKAVICSIGGEHSNQVLKHLDFSVIKNNPKVFVGYSDISVLHLVFHSLGLITFYGPALLTQFGEYPEVLEYTKKHFLAAVSKTEPIGKIESSEEWTDEVLDWITKKDIERGRQLSKSDGYKWLKKGNAEGHLLGGCVPSINHLLGTRFWPDLDGALFFIDIPEAEKFDEGLSVSAFDAFMADLDNVGVFGKIKGLILGRPFQTSPENKKLIYNIILKYTSDYDYPILADANIGHSDPVITIPIGAKGMLDSEKGVFGIIESGVV